METVNITVQINKQVKQEFEDFCSDKGISITTAFMLFAKIALQTRELPFHVTDEDKELVVAEPETVYSRTYIDDFDTWVAKGKPDDRQIIVGTTPVALQSIGIEEKRIVWDTSKLIKIQRDHPDMSDSILRQVPCIISGPIIVMSSKTQLNRVTLYGEVYNDKGIPVLAVLELLPTSRENKVVLNTIRVANAYSKDDIHKTQGIINTSDILYVCPDKIRTDAWLSLNRLQLPLEITKYGSIGTVSYFHRDVNGYFSSKSETQQPEPEWKTKLRELQNPGGEQ